MLRLKIIITVIITSLFFCSHGQVLPYKNAGLSIEERVSDLISRMTLDEKIAQMTMLPLKKLEIDGNGEVTDESLEKLFKGESIGCLESPFIEINKIAELSEAADKYLRTKTRLGIPAIQVAECLHGQMALGSTIFPQSIGLGSTWNPELIMKMGETVAMEASLSGVDQALAPLFDLARDPRYGRVEECYGEDPYLVAEMGKAYIIGMQGNPGLTCQHIPTGHLACTAKHFVAYSTPYAGINIGPVEIGPRELRTLHLYPFEKAIKEANVYSVMPSYNEVNGVPMHKNRFLLRNVLRGEYHFNGYVFSDYSAINMLESFHKTSANKSGSALQALTAGIDLEAPDPSAYPELKELAENGQIDGELIDEAVKNILTVKFKTGLFDKPYKAPGNISGKVHTKESVRLARAIAEESIILLKNENRLLPLDISKMKSIAVIGPNADQVQFGDYSITKSNDYGITVLEGIKQLAGNRMEVNHARGCGITDLSTSGFNEAIELAKKSDVVVLVIGGTSIIYSGIGWGNDQLDKDNTCGEGHDVSSLDPPGVQSELIKTIYATGKPIILLMVHGRPYSIPWEKEHIPAIIEAWYPGEQGGLAIADILFGNVNPSGKLSVSVPQSVGHVPVFYNYKPSGRGYYHKPGMHAWKPGRDYVFSSTEALYPFGYGLSYTEFKYLDMEIGEKNLTGNDTIKVSVRLKNIGSMAGKDVVQLYINDRVSSVTTPVKVLKGFKKISLKPSETGTVVFEVPCAELGLWNENMDYVVEPGAFDIMIGNSSQDMYLEDYIVVNEN